MKKSKKQHEKPAEEISIADDAGAILLRVRCKLVFLSSIFAIKDSDMVFDDDISVSGFGWILEGIADEVETAENKIMPHEGRGKGAA